MTEFKRTTQAVDDIEQLTQNLLDGGGMEEVNRLNRLVSETGPVVAKLVAKAGETDPAKQTYGPAMRERVRTLGERWGPIESLAQDVLRQRGVNALPPAAPAPAGPPPAPAPAHPTLWAPVPSQLDSTMTRPPAASSSRVAASGASAGRVGGGAAPANAQQLREARLARLSGGGGGSAGSPASAAAAGTAPAATDPAPMDVDKSGAGTTSSSCGARHPAATLVAAAPPADHAGPVVTDMDTLLHVVHSVFVGHGFRCADGDKGSGADGLGSMIHMAYRHDSRPAISAMYVPVMRHLVVYAAVEGSSDVPGRVSVQLGMCVASVQAKVDYLLVYPIITRQCVPVLSAIPPEVSFGLLSSLAIPTLGRIGCASKVFSASVFQDDVLWWHVLLALPPSAALNDAVEAAQSRASDGAHPGGTWRRIVRDEVQRARAEAEERRRREEQERAMRNMRDPLLIGGARRPRNPGLPGGLGGFGGLGGDYDLMPGGGFFPGGLGGGMGGRRPFGGGGGGFGGRGIF